MVRKYILTLKCNVSVRGPLAIMHEISFVRITVISCQNKTRKNIDTEGISLSHNNHYMDALLLRENECVRVL